MIPLLPLNWLPVPGVGGTYGILGRPGLSVLKKSSLLRAHSYDTAMDVYDCHGSIFMISKTAAQANLQILGATLGITEKVRS